jgi:uncharacterized protein YjdB
MKRILLILITGLVCTTVMTSCEDENKVEEGNSVPLTGITVNPSSLTVPVNGKQQITATPVPADATDVWFIWSSEDPSVATIYEDGTVYIKKYTPNSITITVRSGSIERTIPVSVQEFPLEEIIAPDSIRLTTIGNVQQITTTMLPANATGVEYTWTSENPDIATVDETGKVTAVSYGTVNVTVSYGSVSTTVVVSVGPESIIVEPAAVEMYYGLSQQITATLVPATDADIDYIWSTEDPSIATVNSTGLITATGVGTTTVTVSFGGASKAIVVNALETAFKGPHILSAAAPCIIEARNFDWGGEGFAFHDSNTNNDPGDGYRAYYGDPAGGAADVEGSGNIGYTNAGEWVQYTVEVQDAGLYEADLRLSVENSGDKGVSISADGVNSEAILIPSNGSWDNWRWIFESGLYSAEIMAKQPKFNLSAGRHKIRVTYETGGFNWISFKLTRIGD